ncbi:hypothetical protein LG198_10695 [Methylobacillus arboreus]|uniref:hypothetical protein n=1 Tax=Methylobacillus arboreus TaxID=755170 RepID=UPI001E565AE5|nr:hypothetical protein [Methylobacillus arboreus]MCB5191196.1 hypothetical protein [Methylobacillus arboreus]
MVAVSGRRYRLLVYISGHGYGHVAQIAPVLNQLAQDYPDIELIVCSAVSEAFLRSRIHAGFAYRQRSADFGMLMKSALEVDTAASIGAYLDFHADWDARVEREQAWIASQEADAVLSNVAYLPLAAASKLGLPALATCSLNWADILRHYADDTALYDVQRQIREAYACARSFLRLEPSMSMPWLNCHEVGPVADIVEDKRDLILQRLGLDTADQHKLVLVGMGGINTEIDPASFPALPGVHWLLPQAWMQGLRRADLHALESLQEHFSILLASSDLVLTKPGYGTFVEAACHGIPVLYVPRDGWPEQDCLVSWLETHGQCLEVNAGQLWSGDFAAEVLNMLATPKPPRVRPRGNQEAAHWISGQLGLE